ncbi:MAG: 5'-nucleotidase [Armatimonadota bacterium]
MKTLGILLFLAVASLGVQTQETVPGDLVADAVLGAGKADVALIPAASLRDEECKPEEAVKCLQYPDDKIAVIELSGDEILRALERSVSIYPQKNLGFLQVAGLKFAFDPKAEKNARVVSVQVGGADLDPAKKYKVALPEPLAGGAYGYFTIWGKDREKKLQDVTLGAAVRDFSGVPETGRITVKE